MNSFEELGLDNNILRAIKELKFENPMPVQTKVIPLMLEDNVDIIALAQTGTGKTAAFGLPLVQSTDTEIQNTQALILCPTRELCMQITNDLNNYSKHTGGLRILAVYGGAPIDSQIRELKRGVHIIVATPGRLIDLIGRRAAKLSEVRTVILDEADEMLNIGFREDIETILQIKELLYDKKFTIEGAKKQLHQTGRAEPVEPAPEGDTHRPASTCLAEIRRG